MTQFLTNPEGFAYNPGGLIPICTPASTSYTSSTPFSCLRITADKLLLIHLKYLFLTAENMVQLWVMFSMYSLRNKTCSDLTSCLVLQVRLQSTDYIKSPFPSLSLFFQKFRQNEQKPVEYLTLKCYQTRGGTSCTIGHKNIPPDDKN